MIDSNLDLSKLDLEALKQIAQDEDLEGRSKLTRKADLLAALEELQIQQLVDSDSTPESAAESAGESSDAGARPVARVFGGDEAVSLAHVLATLNVLRARSGRYVEAGLVASRLSVRRQISAEDVVAVAETDDELVQVDGTALSLTDEGLIAVRGRMTPRRFVAGGV